MASSEAVKRSTLADADGFGDTGDIVELRGDRYVFTGRHRVLMSPAYTNNLAQRCNGKAKRGRDRIPRTSSSLSGASVLPCSRAISSIMVNFIVIAAIPTVYSLDFGIFA